MPYTYYKFTAKRQICRESVVYVTQKDNLEGQLKENFFEIFVLHSEVDPDEHRQAFRRAPEGVRKIILSTNIAETSLTIEDVVSEAVAIYR